MKDIVYGILTVVLFVSFFFFYASGLAGASDEAIFIQKVWPSEECQFLKVWENGEKRVESCSFLEGKKTKIKGEDYVSPQYARRIRAEVGGG